MIDKEKCLQLIAKNRTDDEVVVTTMGTVIPWGQYSDHPLDFASVGSAMGHAADFALGIALAQPERKVLVLNGDGSMLMCLGTLATITALRNPPKNYYLFVCHNGTYEVTGNQPIPENRGFSFTTIAKGAGFEKVYEFDDADSLDTALPAILNQEGPVFIELKITPAEEPPPSRLPDRPVRYLRGTLAESTHELKAALSR
jgi:sulfopyruvate decarboxylase subunit beta